MLVSVFVDLPALYGLLKDGGLVIFALLMVLYLLTFVFAFVCTISDPTDPTIYQEQECSRRG